MSAAVGTRKSERIQVLSETNVPVYNHKPKRAPKKELLSPSSELNAAIASLTLADDRLPTLTNILTNVTPGMIYEIAFLTSQNPKLLVGKSKSFYIETICDAVWSACLSNFYNEFMSASDRDKANKSLSIELEEGRGTLKYNLIYAFKNDATALPHVLEDNYTDERLDDICEAYHVDTSELSKKEDKVTELLHGMRLNATTVFYTSLPIDALREIAGLNDLKTIGPKPDVVYRLVHQMNEESPIPAPEEVKKPNLEKGITFNAIYSAYNLDELRLWCKENDIKQAGTKKELIQKILHFFDGNKEGIMIGDRKIPRRRRNTDGLRKKKRVSKEDKENTAPTKKAAPVKKIEKPAAKKTTRTTTTEPVEVPLTKKGTKKTAEVAPVEEVSTKVNKGKKPATTEPVEEPVIRVASTRRRVSAPKIPTISKLAKAIEGLKAHYDVKPPLDPAEVAVAIKTAKKNGYVVSPELEEFYSLCDGLACTEAHVATASIEFFGSGVLLVKEGNDGRLAEQILSNGVEGVDEECLKPDQTKKCIEIANGNIEIETATHLYLIAHPKSANLGKIVSHNNGYPKNVRIVANSLVNALEDLLAHLTDTGDDADACKFFTPDEDAEDDEYQEEEDEDGADDEDIDDESENLETGDDVKNGIEDIDVMQE